ncbi:MAG TPA: DUF4082 domain-containing protein [Thermoanaerobaculia bacterium]|nr:DUF4082 domain-containing protein [Thermoanaerobaculia bacterium]
MRVTKSFLLVAALAAATFSSPFPVTAAGLPAAPPRLFSLEKAVQPSSSSLQLVPDAAEQFVIEASSASVAANPPAFTLDLPGLPPLEAVRTRFVDYKTNWKSWFGTLRHAGTTEEGSGLVHLGYHGQQLTAYIEFEGKRFRIVGGLGESHRLVRLSDELSPPSCGLDAKATAKPAPVNGGKLRPVIVPKSTSRLDVLAVYPLAFWNFGPTAEAGMVDFVEDSISLANNVFSNSSVDAFYNLVGVVPITGSDQPPATGIFDALIWLRGQPTEVANLRNAFGADIVTIYVPFSYSADNACGVANLPQNNSTYLSAGPSTTTATVNSPMGDLAFTANRDGCGLGDYTLGHEIGHTYGMYHGDAAVSSLAIFPNGRGYVDSVNGFASVMGCYCTSGCTASSAAVCNRIPYFSDPTTLYGGHHIGASDRNNADVARNQVATYAAFRTASSNTPPSVSFSTSCSGRTCTFTSTSTDNTTIPSGGYWWKFGDSTTHGSGSAVTHTFASYGTYYVHLVVTDSGGQTGTTVNTVTPSPSYEGYHEASNCRGISGWAWDHTPDSPINVDIYRDGSYATTTSAGLFRSDLLSAGKGNGYHGFGYTPDSSWRDGTWHAALVRFGGTSTSLTWSPISLICGVTCFTSQTPTDNLDTAGVVYSVGTQFSSSSSGYITSLRFYRASGETGTNTGKLWTDSGTLLASETFPSSPSSGWVEVALSTPVAISASTLYRVSVNTNTHQSKTGCGIGSGITNQVLTAAQGFWVAGNTFPTTSSCSNYFIDVKFDL